MISSVMETENVLSDSAILCGIRLPLLFAPSNGANGAMGDAIDISLVDRYSK